MWRAQVLTLFPQMYPGPLGYSLAGKALENGLWGLETTDLRDYGIGKHRNVDDTPAGGGPGMVMRADVLGPAIDEALHTAPTCPLIYLTPRGAPFTQADAQALAEGDGVTLLCGRFEGIDERVLEARRVRELSLGDFVLSGGDVAALSVLDACVRLLPGVLGAAETLAEESFSSGLLEYPHYTRPAVWDGRPIPEVLLSGDHGKIHAWRQARAEEETRLRRPDMWAKYVADMIPSSSGADNDTKDKDR